MLGYQREVDSVRAKVYGQWAIRYRSFIQRRFNNFSRGGGDWPALKIRVGGSILRDTSTLFSAMAPTLVAPAGSINSMEHDGITVGYDGNASHPGGPTIAQIAYWHQVGAGNNPVRQIIVPPDSATLQGMVNDMARALQGQPS